MGGGELKSTSVKSKNLVEILVEKKKFFLPLFSSGKMNLDGKKKLFFSTKISQKKIFFEQKFGFSEISKIRPQKFRKISIFGVKKSTEKKNFFFILKFVKNDFR